MIRLSIQKLRAIWVGFLKDPPIRSVIFTRSNLAIALVVSLLGSGVSLPSDSAEASGSSVVVTFVANGGIGAMDPQVSTVSATLSPNIFTRTSYTFSGWNTLANGTGLIFSDEDNYSFSTDLTLYAQWTANGSVVTFGANGGTGSMDPQISSTSTTLTPNAFAYTNRTFLGWNTSADGSGTTYTDGQTYSFATNLNLFARWSAPMTHTVTFNANGGTGTMAAQISSESAALRSNAFARTNYAFTGWNTAADGSGTSYSDGQVFEFTDGLTLFAQWSVTSTFAVTFNANGGSGSMSAQTGSDPAALNANSFTRANYAFLGWNTAANGSGTDYLPGSTYDFTASVTLYAQWSSAATITFHANFSGGSADTTQVIVAGTVLTKNPYVRSGYVFSSWNTLADGTGTSFPDGYGVESNKVSSRDLYAQWIAVSGANHGVTFNANGGFGALAAQTASTATALRTNAFSAPASTYPKAFRWWNTAADGSGTTYANSATFAFDSDVTLYAQWGYTVAFKSNYTGGPADVTQVVAPTSTALRANTFTRSGYAFVGWATVGIPSSSNAGTSYGDSQAVVYDRATNVYAQWVAVSGAQKAVRLVGRGGLTTGGSPVPYSNQVSSTAAVLSVSPMQRGGYTFMGWDTNYAGLTVVYADGDTYPFSENGMLFAVWQTNKVVFDSNGGAGTMSAQSSTTSVALSNNSFTKSGQIFAGWNTASDGTGVAYAANQTYAFASPNMSATLYAQWVPVVSGQKSLVYSGNGATAGSMSVQFSVGSAALQSNTFTRAGYQFAGWATAANGTGTKYVDGATYPFSSTANVIYAQWTPLVTYVSNYTGSTTPNVTQVVTSTSTTLTPNTFTRSGYAFKGWSTSAAGNAVYGDGQTLTISNITNTGALTLYAVWVAVTGSQHLVSFVANWNANNSLGHQVASTSTALTEFTNVNGSIFSYGRTGYQFLGWSTTQGGVVEFANKVAYSFSADMTLYAIWQMNTITFDSNGGSGTLAPQSGTASANISTNAFSRSGFAFSGWNTKADGTGTAYADGVGYPFNSTNQSTVLFAQWTALPGNVVVTYSANGGTGRMDSQSSSSGTTITLQPNQFTKSGQVFLGWNTAANGSGQSYLDGQSVLLGTNLALFAMWGVADTYTVQFNANTGTGSMSNISSSDGTLALPQNTFTKAGSVFAGWNSNSSGTGTSYGDASTISLSSNLTLYAMWVTLPAGNVAIDFNANGGSGSTRAPILGSATSSFTVPASTYSRARFVFSGWSTSADGSGTDFAVGTTAQIPASSITLYAQWTQSWFTVAFDSNGGSGTMSDQTSASATNLSRNSFTRSLYSFTGWNTAADGSGDAIADAASFTFTADTTLYAQWAKSVFTVEFNASGGTGTMLAQSATSSTALRPNSFTKSGFRFGGWSTTPGGSATYAEGAVYGFSADTTLYAVWIAVYSVTFDANGGSGAMSNQPAETSTPLSLNQYTRSGYTFDGWNTASNGGGTNYRDGAPYAFGSSTTLYAQWRQTTYTVTFDSNGGTGSMSAQTAAGSASLTGNSFTRNGYTFMGWAPTSSASNATYADAASFTFSANTLLYAVWSANSYVVTFDSQGGSAVSAGSYVTAGSVTLPSAPTRTGYTFLGWFTTASGAGSALTSPWSPGTTAAVTLYARWSINSYVVTYDAQGGSAVSAGSYVTAGSVTLPSDPTRTGYTFLGWFTTASGAGSALTSPWSPGTTSAVTLYARWSINSYVVTYDSQGGSSVSAGSYVTVGSVTLPSDPTRTGYTFLGWFTATSGAGSALTSPWSPGTTSAVTLYARWSANSYVVTYDAQGGSSVSAGSYVTAGSVTLPSDPTRTGYTFLGWFTTASGAGSALTSPWSPGTTSAVTLYARWSANSYVVTYDAQGGSAVFAGSYETDGSLVLSDPPVRANFYFLGWFTSASGVGTALTSPWSPGLTGDLTLYARWSEGEHEVTFDPNGGNGSRTTQTGAGLVALDRTTFTKLGYTFAGWATSSTATTALYPDGGNYSFASDEVLFAVWSANSYSVTFDSNGGTAVTPSEYQSGGVIELPAGPRRLGYTFLGWFLTASGDDSKLPDVWRPGTLTPLTLFARWAPIAAPATEVPAPTSSASAEVISRIPTDVMPFVLQTTSIFSLTGGGNAVTITPDGRIELTPDQSVALVNGVPVAATVTIDSNGISFAHDGVTVTFRAVSSGSGSTSDVAQVTSGATAETSGSGFAPKSDVAVWIQSNPIQLKTLQTSLTGDVFIKFVVPTSVAPGEHTIQLNGLDANGNLVSFLYGLEVLEAEPAPASTPEADDLAASGGMPWTSAETPVVVGLGVASLATVGVLLTLWFALRRRSRR